MLNLVKIEFLKLKRKDKYFFIILVFLAVSVLIIPSMLMLRRLNSSAEILKSNFNNINIIPNIFLCVLTGELFMNEYKDKTINIMFSYPLSRVKIYFAKLIVIFSYSFAIAFIDILWLGSMFRILNKIDPIRQGVITTHAAKQAMFFILANTLVNTLFTIAYSFFVIVKRSGPLMSACCGVLILTEVILLGAHSSFYLEMLSILGGISVILLIPILYTLTSKDVL